MKIRFYPRLAALLLASCCAAAQAQIAGGDPYSASKASSPYGPQRPQGNTSEDNPYAPGGLYDPYRASRLNGAAPQGSLPASGGSASAFAHSGTASGAAGGMAGAGQGMTARRRSMLHGSTGGIGGRSVGGNCDSGAAGSSIGAGNTRMAGGLAGNRSSGLGGIGKNPYSSTAPSRSYSTSSRCGTTSQLAHDSAGELGGGSGPGVPGQMSRSGSPGASQGLAAQMQNQQYQKLQQVPR